MPIPGMSLTNMTATGDVITGPGAPGVLLLGFPVAAMGDMVTGSVCVGVIAGSAHPNVIVKGRPVAVMTSPVTGANPIIGIPVATVCAVSTHPDDLL
ncbi:MAG: PAAR domain-containing protein [Victivallaceae bacterium]|nr:PAAR domain-containing protein [Victivallaceae bacterium]